MATTKITNPELFDLGSLNTALRLPSGSTDQRPTSPSTGEWRYNTTTNLIEFYDGADWRELQSEDIPPIPSENFNVVLYTGNSSTQSITGVGFQPDWIAIKDRSATNSWRVFDSTRGLTSPQTLFFNLNFVEDSESNTVSSFDADGFTMGSQGGVNTSGNNYVAYCWKANAGTTSTNTDGSITSTVQTNTKARFSIIKYTGNGVAGATIGHNLGAVPDMFIVKRYTGSGTWNWRVYHKGMDSSSPQDYNMALNSNSARFDRTEWNDTAPTSTVFSVDNHGSVNENAIDYICYAFADTAGYSRFGSYTGNGSTNGPIINVGFEPAFVMIKRTDAADAWYIYDNKRTTSNPRNKILLANTTDAELTSTEYYSIDFLSNGFQLRSALSTATNANGGSYIYMAFAATPSTPTLADSFSINLYTGTGSATSISGLGFSPSFAWIKGRTNTASHQLFDILRGATYQISSDTTGAQTQNTQMLTSFNTDGFSLGNQSSVNGSGVNYVAWNWKANPIPTINTDGTIQSVVSANQAAGFSIVRYTGNSTAGATVGHGLSSAPESVIIKCLNTGSTNWINYYDSIGNSDYLTLNLTNDVGTFSNWFYSNASTFTLNQTFGNANTSGRTYVAYCFKSISGFSKIGSYTGTGAAGNTVSIGFEPSWIMIKRSDSSGGWLIFDSKRNTSNPRNNRLEANNASAEQTGSATKFVDFDATSFEPQISDSEINASGGTYVYMAFKENPSPVVPAGQMAYLVVAGGAGGGGTVYPNKGGGGGAGGLRTSFGSTSGGGASAESNITLASGTYTITVGAGGGAAANGVASSISGGATVSTVGGGQGGAISVSGTAGGSGGGMGGNNTGGLTGGAGTAGEGFDGGTTGGNAGYDGSGGGGAAQAGGNGGFRNSTGGVGGNGLEVSITGTGTYYAGGGGGGSDSSSTGGRPGGLGGGGAGGDLNVVGGNGTANLGGGAGAGGENAQPGSGGSGVVILRLRTSDYSGTTTGSPTVTTTGDETVLTFTGSGTYVHS